MSNSLIFKTDRAHQQIHTNSQSLQSIEEGVKGLSDQQQLQTSILASHASSSEKLDAKLDMLINGMTQLIVTQQSVTASPAATSKDWIPSDEISASALISRLSTDSSNLGKHTSLRDFVCRCPKPGRSYGIKRYPSFNAFWTSSTVHFPGCCLYNFKRKACVAGTTFKIPGRKAVSFIEAIFTWGAVPLQYRINCRNIVPNRAPAFLILVQLWIYSCSSIKCDPHNLVDALNVTLRALSLLFQGGRAGPADVESNGWNIVQVSSK